MTEAEKYMRLALDLAASAGERTYPNPMVGAVIVKGGRVVGRGYHEKAGLDHAEVAALKSVKGSCKGATMFVTLEPCDHYGKTPPCTKAIISSGIKEVYAAMKDPNPINSGKGIRKLREAGIRVNVGVMASEAKELVRKYTRFITKKMPYVTIKLAQSIDGKIAATDGTSKWISSEKSRKLVREMRGKFDAVMVGIGTVLVDDPFLLDAAKKGYATRRVVIDSRLRIPERSNLIKTADRSPVLIAVTPAAPGYKVKKLARIRGVEVIMARAKSGKVDLGDLFGKLAERGIVNILVEGGGELAGSLFDEGYVDEVIFFISPKVIGGGSSSVKGKGARTIVDAIRLRDVEISMSGDDIMVEGKIKSK
jgi:diaminohydroxyphosphoribosylaminopyrimidine deaminase/5-amino-6-(5-phosphoribosylamino)uracil reductase